jgi:plasmid stabilization system protein ParE
LKVRFSPRARRRAATINKWWRANRPAVPDLFDRELAEITGKLAATPTLGTIYATICGELVMRLLLPRTEQHLYYSVDKAGGVVRVITIWGARRGRPPRL